MIEFQYIYSELGVNRDCKQSYNKYIYYNIIHQKQGHYFLQKYECTKEIFIMTNINCVNGDLVTISQNVGYACKTTETRDRKY